MKTNNWASSHVDLYWVTERLNELGYAFELVDTGGGCIYPYFRNIDPSQCLVISDSDGDSYSLHFYLNEEDEDLVDLEFGITSHDEIVALAVFYANLMWTRSVDGKLSYRDLEEFSYPRR